MSAKSRLSHTHRKIFDTLKAHKAGLTVGECWRAAFSERIDTKDKIAPRLNEMLRMGVVEKASKRRCQETNHMSTVWIATNDKPMPIMYRNRLTEFLVIEVDRNQVVQRAENLRSISPEYRNDPQKYEIWRATSA